MGFCAVVDCDQLGLNVVTIATSWGAWEHSICDQHHAEVDGGARLHHDPDYRVTLDAGFAAEIVPRVQLPEQACGSDDIRVRPLRPRRRRAGRVV